MLITRSIDCSQCHPRQHSIFCGLSETELKYLKDYKVTKTFKKREMIFRESDTPHGLFCVFDGMVKLYKSSDAGSESIVRLHKSGDVLGYRSFFSGEKYMASAQAVTESTVCFIDRAGIELLIKSSPEVVYSLLKKVCVELREAEEKFQDLLGKTVEERLAYFMTLFMKGYKSKTIDLPLSREEIASIIGARPETVIRVFSSWKERGYLQVHAKSITVLDSSFLPAAK